MSKEGEQLQRQMIAHVLKRQMKNKTKKNNKLKAIILVGIYVIGFIVGVIFLILINTILSILK